MSYQALYRKYRPQTFSDVVGQEHITETLKNELSAGKVTHAYLFTERAERARRLPPKFWQRRSTA